MSFYKNTGKISNNQQLEMARAREIHCTYVLTGDKKLVMRHIKASSQWHTEESVKRIFTYFKEML